jgi:hypothetical protein
LDDLADALKGMGLGTDNKPKEEPKEGGAAPSRGPLNVPAGTALHFICLEDGIFKLTGKCTAADDTTYAV